MDRQFARAELIDRLLAELDSNGEKKGRDPEFSRAFAQVILRRVDNKYLFKHRLTTLGAQLADSAAWVQEYIATGEVEVRAFRPTSTTHGYDLEGRIIETLMPDQPFIFDTLKLLMQRQDVLVHNSLNVIIPVRKNGDFELSIQTKLSKESTNFSYTRWYVDWPDTKGAEDIVESTLQSLKMSQDLVTDYHRMVRALHDAANEFDYLAKVDKERGMHAAEVHDFLEWLVTDNFVFMGISFYDLLEGEMRVDASRGLGSMRGETRPSGRTTDRVLEFLGREGGFTWPVARVQKSSEDSIVHRSGKVDEVLIRTFDDQGELMGGMAIHGLFTFKGLGEPGSSIPMLRRKVIRILETNAPVVGSYERKSLLNAFNALPVEFLFEANDQVVNDLLDLSLRVDTTGEFQSEVVLNEDTNSAYAFVVLPKSHFSDELRADLQRHLQATLGASYCDHRVYIGKFGSVALHFYCTGEPSFREIDLDKLKNDLYELGTPWSHRLRRSLDGAVEERKSAEFHARFGDAFPEGYSDIVHPDDAVIDIGHLVRLVESGKTRFHLLESRSNPSQALLRIYSLDEVSLTKILPVVDNFGVVVAEQYAFAATPRSGETLWVNTLRVELGDDDVLAQAKHLIGGLRAVFLGRMRSDRLNRLLLAARLTWKEVDVFRAFYIYSRQLGLQFQLEGLRKILMNHRGIVADLAALFRLRFDPALDVSKAKREAQTEAHSDQIRAALEEVKTFEEDRVLRTFLNFIESTVRTNFYATHEDKEHFLSFKIDSSCITEMPNPRPMFEILVHHAELDGIHLRGGKVARGGLRWSERHDDFRSEVLGLMATQMLKNTLIVPVGAKGGFVLTNPPEDYAEARSAADRLYRVFIRGLLEVTDNIVDGDVRGPENVVCHDSEDPYLVVAADKGTAHLSDTANALSQEVGFWLGDAFASGGSVGYDHKEKGITAKGAWVSVQRHFLEMGMDPERDPITVVGIGDMSGDVFGNGMLLSSSMRLIAAFNHQHIFIDPNPDPQASFAERKRLFEMGRSQWLDYDTNVISSGGGLYERNARRIELSAEAQAALGTELSSTSGEELIRTILKAEVDLLWNGGIGTYIKASTETHQDVGDKDNDAVRVDAAETRCKVVGEGGNLGVTMRGRVEYSQAGGRINLDAIDNSGGVDLSDHEVNLKTLLEAAVTSKKLDRDARDTLLMRVGDAVCEDVLENSRINALGISLDALRSERDLWAYQRVITNLRDDIGFSRRIELLPRGDTYETRVDRGLGLYRPELGKLLAFSKMFAYRRLLTDPAGTNDELMPFLRSYFPTEVAQAYESELGGHMLFREIAATVQVNHVVGRAGVEFIPGLVRALERDVHEIVAVYLILEEFLGAEGLRREIESLEGRVPVEVLYCALIRLEDDLRGGVVALLSLRPSKASLRWAGDLEGSRELIQAFDNSADIGLPLAAWASIATDIETLDSAGVPGRTSRRLALARFSALLPAIFTVAETSGLDAPAFASHFFYAGSATGIESLRSKITSQSYRDDWDQLAIHSIDRALLGSLIEIAKLSISQAKDPSEARLLAVDGPLHETAQSIEAFGQGRVPVSACFVLNERIRDRVLALRT